MSVNFIEPFYTLKQRELVLTV